MKDYKLYCQTIDLGNVKFGKLIAIKPFDRNSSGALRWLCKCDCGKTRVALGSELRRGTITSCGCESDERRIKANEHRAIHNKADARLYGIWNSMRSRCNNPRSQNFHNYGGRGICICDDWNNDFMEFYSWSMDNEYDDNLSIDRINNDGNYEPTNCRWTTSKIQTRNARYNKIITINNLSKTVVEWAEYSGLNYQTLYDRIRRGWVGEELLIPPYSKRK